MSDPHTSPPPDRDWRDMRRDERWESRRYRRDTGWGGGGSWVVGLILIALGALFLAQNFGYPIPHNWWAVFLIVPALASFGSAWSMYQRNGRRTSPPVTAAFLTGLVLAGLAAVLLLDIQVGKFWPVLLIVFGLAVLLGGGRWRQLPPR